MKSLIHVFMLVLPIVCLKAVLCHSGGPLRQLHDDLIDDYRKDTLPLFNYTMPLRIGTMFHLYSLIGFSDTDETLSILGFFSFNWTDPFLTWNSSLYGDIVMTTIDASNIWTPLLSLLNNADKMEQIGGDAINNALIINNGEVYFYVGDVFKAKCKADVKNFPFDHQSCEFEFLIWGVPQGFANIVSLLDKIDLKFYKPNSDWSLIEYSSKSKPSLTFANFILSIKIKRVSLYYVVMVIIPALLLAIMNPLVYVLPVDSGERVGFAMTMLLAYAIFLTIVSSSIPVASDPICVLLVVMVVVIGISAFIVFGVIISGKYFSKDDKHQIPTFLLRLSSWHCRRNMEFVSDSNNTSKEGHRSFVTGSHVSAMIDSVFFYGSYMLMLITFLTYFCLITW